MTKASFSTVTYFLLAILASAFAIHRFEQGLWVRGIIHAVLWVFFATLFIKNYIKLPDK
jgi:hypothetical protein